MTTYQFPSSLTPNASQWTLVTNSRRFTSPITRATQVVQRKGTLWRVDLTFDSLTTTERGALQGFIAKLDGQVHRVRLKDHSFVRQGTGGGAPLVNGPTQSGSSLVVDGAGTVTNWLRAGDLLSFDKESSSGTDTPQLHRVTTDVNSSGGNATIPIAPPLRNAPPNDAPVEITNPEGVFMLVSDPAWNNRPGSNILSSFSLTFIQDVLE